MTSFLQLVGGEPLLARVLAGLAAAEGDALRIGVGSVLLNMSQRERGILIQGVSGYGKTRLLVAMALQDLLAGRRGGLLDPVGASAQLLLEYLGALTCAIRVQQLSASRVVGDYYELLLEQVLGRVHVLDLSDPGQSQRINLCRGLPGMSASQVVDNLILPVLTKELGELTEARRLMMVLRSALLPVVEVGGTLADVLDLLSVVQSAETIEKLCNTLDRRAHRLGRRRDIVRRYFREMYLRLPDKERLVHTQSAWHALGTILGHPMCAQLFGSTQSSFDVGRIIEDGGYMVVLVPQHEGAAASIVCSSVMQLITQACLRRGVRRDHGGSGADDRDFYLIVDEFHLALARDRSMHDLVATCRNVGLRLCVAFQHERQGDLGQDPDLVANWRANTATHIYLRCALDSAKNYIAEHVHHPRGLRVKRRYLQKGWSVGSATSVGVTKQVSLALAFGRSQGKTWTLSRSNGRSVSITRSKGLTIVESEGVTVAEGRGFQQVETDSFALTHSDGQTVVRGKSQGESSARGSSVGRGSTHTDSDVVGVSTSPSNMDGSIGTLGIPTNRQSVSATQSQSSSQSTSENLSKAVSSVVSEAHSVSSSESQSEGHAKSTGTSRTVSTAHSESLARAVASVVALGESLVQQVGLSTGTSQTESVSRTRGRTIGSSVQRSSSQGQSVRELEELYSLDEEIRILAYEISGLPRQHAIMVSDAVDGSRQVTRMKIVDVPDTLTSIAGLDGLAEVRERCSGPRRAPAPPRGTLFDRARGRK